MKFIPHLFMPDMVRQIISGNKTMTSRIITKINSVVGSYPCKYSDEKVGWYSFDFTDVVFDGKEIDREYIKVAAPIDDTRHRIYPKYEVGDIIWVREICRDIEQDFGEPRYEYKATERINLSEKWKPSIHMPKEACRLFLKITKVKASKANEITAEEAIMEGVEHVFTMDDGLLYVDYMYRQEKGNKKTMISGPGKSGLSRTKTACFNNPVESFRSLWIKIHGIKSWNNDLVWRPVFEKVELTKKERKLFLQKPL